MLSTYERGSMRGGNERIMKFPFPHDHSGMSKRMVYLFIVLVPFSLVPEMMRSGHWAFRVSIPIAIIIGLVFIIMEEIGGYNEDPFMGTPNRIPLPALCRTVEVDLREMPGEQDVPKPIPPMNGVLM